MTATTNFTAGTVVSSAWSNAIDSATFDHVYNAKLYGAIGDGVTDDTAALNAALAAIKAAGGGKLWLPYGNYYVTSTVGNAPQTTTDWNDNTEIIGDKGTTITVSASYSGTVLSLNGDNVAIRNLAITSARTITHSGDLVAQRVVYQLGIVIGGKLSVGTLSTFKSGAQVTDCTITNMNEPLTVTMADNVLVSRNTIDSFTDTGIMIQDCTTDIWVTDNLVTRGGDDCIFIRHYSTTPWATATNYCGRVKVHNNILNDTFGKNIGIGGYGDVEISDNYCGLSWAGGINLEKDDWYKTVATNYRNYLITDNQIVDAGRNWNTAMSYAAHQVPNTGSNPSGIHTVYANTFGAINYSNVTISNNIITNPYQDAIALSATNYVFVSGNTFTPGSTNHGAGAVSTQGVMVNLLSEITHAYVTGNRTNSALGVTVNYSYLVGSGSGTTSNIFFANNFDLFNTEAISYSDASARSATTFSTVHYGDQGTATFAAATTKVVTLTRYQPDANYRVALGPQGNNTFWVSNKLAYQFTLNAASSTSDVVEWMITR